MITVFASGYFDPLHIGHIQYLNMARELGDQLIVIVNNDIQAKLKKTKPFMRQLDRYLIVKNLKCVDNAYLSIDSDLTVCRTLKRMRELDVISSDWIFAKGGDRYANEIPEAEVCRELGIKIVDGLGSKIRASSEFINSVRS